MLGICGHCNQEVYVRFKSKKDRTYIMDAHGTSVDSNELCEGSLEEPKEMTNKDDREP